MIQRLLIFPAMKRDLLIFIGCWNWKIKRQVIGTSPSLHRLARVPILSTFCSRFLISRRTAHQKMDEFAEESSLQRNYGEVITEYKEAIFSEDIANCHESFGMLL